MWYYVDIKYERGYNMAIEVIGKCPVCGDRLSVTALHCDKCNIEIKGSFSLNKFSYLSEQSKGFLETFLSCMGNLKDVQSVLGISYPTAKKQLDSLMSELGIIGEAIKQSNMDILKKIESGELSPAEATELIRKNRSRR